MITETGSKKPDPEIEPTESAAEQKPIDPSTGDIYTRIANSQVTNADFDDPASRAAIERVLFEKGL